MPWRERQLNHYAKSLDGCTEPNQAFDVDNDRYIREHVLNVPILVTSARPRQSEFYDGLFAQVGFQFPNGADGQFSIGGQAAYLPLRLQRFDQLPATLILRTGMSRQDRQFFQWERALCKSGWKAKTCLKMSTSP
jgi:hypothetical protein